MNGRDDAPRSHTLEGGLQDWARGMFVNLTVGDTIGMPAEFKELGKSEPVGGLHADGPFDLPTGHWIDDTSMALCLADSLLTCGGYDSYDVMDRYRRWRRERYRSSTGVCFDIGNRVVAVISEFESNPWVLRGRPQVLLTGNESIMRPAPTIVIAFGARRPKSIVEAAGISTWETHYSVEAKAGMELFAAMLVCAMEGADKLEVCSPRPLNTGEQSDAIFDHVVDVEKLENTGYIVHSLQVAAWILASHENFCSGILAVVNLDGDSDTNGATYGQLVGTYYGCEVIPRAQRGGVFMADEIIVLADDLLVIKACPILRT